MKFCHCADRVEMESRLEERFEDNPVNGACCKCSYDQDEETPCPGGDGSHCMHWWEGPDGKEA